VLAGVVVIGAASVVASPAAPASAYPYPDVTLQVHGFGGGVGMGQWGALGYAVTGSTYTAILQHYYGSLNAGGTTTIGVPAGWSDSTPVSVALTENTNGGNLNIIVRSDTAFTAGGVSVPADGAALFSLSGSTWTVETSTTIGAGSCGGPWSAPTPAAGNIPDAVPGGSEPLPGNVSATALTLCYVGGNLTVRGDIDGVLNSDSAVRAVNVLPLGQYVADVTPSESPASWGSLGSAGPQGEAWGFQELEAQAVAARSYVMAETPNGYFGYADICDTTACQDYPGIANEIAITDTATINTAGQAVLLPGGAPALTQYSSSTGGYTAGGTFAPVVDAGDSICITGACNPWHSYTVSIPVSAIEAQFPQIGTLVSVAVSERNGLGDFGGRVLDMSVEGSAQTVSLTGNTFAADFSSFGADGVALTNWFSVEGQPSGGIAGYWLVANDGGIFSYGTAGFAGSMGGKALDAPMVGMARTTDSGGYWTVASDGGIFSFGDASFHGSMGGKHLDAPMVGMAPTADGGGYWTVASDGGVFSFGDALFHGSMGGQHLDQPIVGMAATPDGGGYWLVGADGGVFSFGDAPYEGSLPGIGLAATAVSILPTATGLGYIIVTANGRAIGFGDAPQFGDVAGQVPGYSGHLVGGALVPE
jgi:hypothetical protein